MADFIVLGSKITTDGDCSHEIKRCLLLGRKVMTNLDSILKSRHITLPTKVCLVKAMFSPVVMYRCENWTRKKAEKSKNENCSVVSDSLQPHGLYVAHQAPLSPWAFPSKNTRVDCHFQRFDAFELWCWKRHLRVSWTARRSNQSILKEINPGY